MMPLRPNSLHSIPGPDDIFRAVLPNGIVLLSRPNFNSPSVVISGYYPAGSLLDSDDKLGLADFTASALMRGTQNRDFQQIYNALESVGASLGFGGGTHTASFSGKALAEDLDLVLDLLSDALRRPVFPAEHIERMRSQLLTGLAIRAEDTGEMASLTLDQLIYPNHPYARPEDGYPETIQTIAQADLVDFHCRHYGPHGLVMAVVGAVEPQAALDKVAGILGDWENPLQVVPEPLPPLTPLNGRRQEKVPIPGKFQTDIAMGAPGPSRRVPEFLAASLGNNILGQFGMMGRIGDVVREKAGLAYYASSSLGGGIGPSPWEISAGVDPANAQRAVDLILQEIGRFVSEPVSLAELEDSQANYIGRLPLSLESNGGVTASLLNLERYGLELDYYRRYPEYVRAVTPEKVLEAARAYLAPDRLGIAIAGP